MATNFRHQIGDTPSFSGLAFHNGWQDGKAHGRIPAASSNVLSTAHKNLVNFRPLTSEFTTHIWQPL